MKQKNTKNTYDDGNIPEIDLPQDAGITHAEKTTGRTWRSIERRPSCMN